MTIKIENYQMESHKGGGFDLYRLSTAKSGKSIGQETKSLLGYNMSVERCVNEIAHQNIHDMNVITDLNGFLVKYKEEKIKLTELTSTLV